MAIINRYDKKEKDRAYLSRKTGARQQQITITSKPLLSFVEQKYEILINKQDT